MCIPAGPGCCSARIPVSSSSATLTPPDVAFVAAGRTAAIGRTGYVPFAPDLAVEILSPGDRPAEVLEKIADWLETGTRLVWVIEAERRRARVHRSDGTIDIVREDQPLEGEDVLPGFSCPLREVLGGAAEGDRPQPC
jgi:Uma2 family endonuclease